MRNYVIPPSKQDLIDKINRIVDKEIEKLRIEFKYLKRTK